MRNETQEEFLPQIGRKYLQNVCLVRLIQNIQIILQIQIYKFSNKIINPTKKNGQSPEQTPHKEDI